jgi:hypothetical protein
MYHADIADLVENTPILPYVYPDAYTKTVAINYCCEVCLSISRGVCEYIRRTNPTTLQEPLK